MEIKLLHLVMSIGIIRVLTNENITFTRFTFVDLTLLSILRHAGARLYLFPT